MSRILKPYDVITAPEVFRLSDHPAGLQPPIATPEPEEQEQATEQAAEPPMGDICTYRSKQLEEQARVVYEAAIRQSQEESEAILAKARAQAKQEADQILQMVLEEANNLRSQILEDARREAAQEKAQEIEQALLQVQTTLDELHQQHTRFLQQYEQELKSLALEIASKILNKRVEQDDTQLLELVKAAIESIKQVPWMSVQLSRQNADLIAALQEHLATADLRTVARIEVVPAELPSGSCLIETPEGIVDASVSTQLENLNESFQQAEAAI